MIPGLGRSPGEGNGNPLQYSFLENSMDRGSCPWGHKESDVSERLYVCVYVKRERKGLMVEVRYSIFLRFFKNSF